MVEEGGNGGATQVAALRVLSDLMERSQLASRAGLTFQGKRDVFAALGYKKTLTVTDYRERYKRNGLAARVVESLPKATWRGGAELIEDEDPEKETEFEKAWLELDERLKVWATFSRLDILAGLGRYAVLLVGAPGGMQDPLPETFSADQLSYLTPFSEDDATIQSWDGDTRSPRFGLPKTYQVKRTATSYQTGGMGGSTFRMATKTVHYSRILHIADGCLDDLVYGQPRLERVWNYFDDLEKLTGAGSEAFWRRVHQGLIFRLEKDLEMSAADATAVQDAADELMHDLRRNMAVRGMDVTPLGSDVSNFAGQVDALETLIAGATGIPKRILVGSERGELSSSQDRTNWDTMVSDRRQEFAEPWVVRPLVDMLIRVGVLPTPTRYNVRWPELSQMEPLDKAKLADAYAGLNAKAGGVVITPAEIRDQALGLEALTPEQIAEAQPTPPPPEAPPAAPGTPPEAAARYGAACSPAKVREVSDAILSAVAAAKRSVSLDALRGAVASQQGTNIEYETRPALAKFVAALRGRLGFVLHDALALGGEAAASELPEARSAGGPGSGWFREKGHVGGSQSGKGGKAAVYKEQKYGDLEIIEGKKGDRAVLIRSPDQGRKAWEGTLKRGGEEYVRVSDTSRDYPSRQAALDDAERFFSGKHDGDYIHYQEALNRLRGGV